MEAFAIFRQYLYKISAIICCRKNCKNKCSIDALKFRIKSSMIYARDFEQVFEFWEDGKMDYINEIISLLKKLDTDKLKSVYMFLKGLLD